MAYTWHEVSKEEKEEIRKNAKNLLDEFSLKINEIKFKEEKEDSRENLRIENSGWKTDENFREIMAENAPEFEDNLIIVERGGWKK
jgi:hypothetical protein